MTQFHNKIDRKATRAFKNMEDNLVIAPDDYIVYSVEQGSPYDIRAKDVLDKYSQIENVLQMDITHRSSKDNVSNYIDRKFMTVKEVKALKYKANGGNCRKFSLDSVAVRVKGQQMVFITEALRLLDPRKISPFINNLLRQPQALSRHELYNALKSMCQFKEIFENTPYSSDTSPRNFQNLLKLLDEARSANLKAGIGSIPLRNGKISKIEDIFGKPRLNKSTGKIYNSLSSRSILSDLISSIWLLTNGQEVLFTNNFILNGVVYIPEPLLPKFLCYLTGDTKYLHPYDL